MRCPHLVIMGLILIFTMIAASSADNKASAYCSKGVRLYEQNDYPGAIEAFEQALSIDENNVDAQKGLCKAMEAQGDCDDLRACCAKLSNLDQSKETSYVVKNLLKSQNCYQKTHGSLGYTSGNYEELLDLYNKSIAKNRNDTQAWNEKGIALGQLDRLDESIACFDAIIGMSIFPVEAAIAWNNVGVSLDKMDRHNEALEAYNRSIQINPGLAEAWHNKAKTLALNPDAFDAAHECDQNALRMNSKLNGGIDWVYAEF